MFFNFDKFLILKIFNFIFLIFFFFFFPLIWICRKIVFQFFKKLSNISIWTGQPIITLAINCQIERQLGFRSISIVRTSYFITNKFDFIIDQIAYKNKFIALILEYISFFVICCTAKQVHTYFDGGILRQTTRGKFNDLELQAYSLLRIKLLVWTYGGDIRTQKITRELGQPNCCTDCTKVEVACVCKDEIGEMNFKKVSSIATQIFSIGDLIEYTPKSNNKVFFWPVDLDADFGLRYSVSFTKKPSTNDLPLRIIHASNHSELKGTRYLVAAVKELKMEGHKLELIIVKNTPNIQAMEIYKTADIIFDQCLIGFHGYFALEAMAIGKPVMSFIRKPNEYLLQPSECPIININVMNIKEKLQYFLKNRSELYRIGKLGRSYIEKYFSMQSLEKRLKTAYEKI
jgi:glycosyltransferase involved in cell wall biosynthesis